PKKESLRIKFPSYKQTGVSFREEASNGHQCFRMSGGKVQVLPPGLDGKKKYYVHVETRIGIHGKPERCFNADKDGCGGIGSCVHCDICRMASKLQNFVQIYKKDQPAKCSAEGFKPGEYDDLSLKICLPTKKELLPFLDPNPERAEELWKVFVSSRSKGG
ncbi:Protein C34E7.4, partial [Aphelenchoides avenae]